MTELLSTIVEKIESFNKKILEQEDRLAEQDRMIEDLIKDQDDMEELLAKAIVMGETAISHCETLRGMFITPLMVIKPSTSN